MNDTFQKVTSQDAIAIMAELVSGIARSLVDLPQEVSVEAVPSQDGTLLRLTVAAGDVGKVIGKQGRTARSLRTIISAASMKFKQRFSLDILEETKAADEP